MFLYFFENIYTSQEANFAPATMIPAIEWLANRETLEEILKFSNDSTKVS
jgi:hypothetical protein